LNFVIRERKDRLGPTDLYFSLLSSNSKVYSEI
jgi:hypothetical protein